MQSLLRNLPKVLISPKFYKDLPEGSGIYIFFKGSKVLYVGKAINLKRRVASYFDITLAEKTAKMVGQANVLGYIKTDSELSALLLEAKLIRKFMPRYNSAAKDDKHPLFILITKEKFPRIITARKLDTQGGKPSYGPFPDSYSVRNVLRIIRRIFPYSDHKLGKRPCLYSHIGLCDPCPNEISGTMNDELRALNSKKYMQNIKAIKRILDGNIEKVKKGLEKAMKEASDRENYEEARGLRDKILQLEYVTRPVLPTEYFLKNPNLYEDMRLKEIRQLTGILRGTKLVVNKLDRIECFDIAHLAGTSVTASMVTFKDGEPDKKYYRHFKIRAVKGGDDYGSLAEVASRRANHLDDWGMPDLIIVDGGAGQVKAFDTALLNAVAEKIPVVGVAKHPDRLIIISDKSEKVIKIRLTGPALNLVARIRDEAHRFARRLHHKVIKKSLFDDKLNK